MIVNVYERTVDGVSLVLRLESGGKWEGEKRIWDWLTDEKFDSLEGRFDPKDPEHLRKLPLVLSGSRIWAAEVDR